MKTISYKDFLISVEKYSFSDTYVVWGYYVCTISNSDDIYYMGFLDNGLTEDEVLKQCMKRLKYKNRNSVKITTNDVYQFIKDYKDEINKFNQNFDVEIRGLENGSDRI